MNNEQWIWQFDRVIPSDPSAGRKLLDEILAKLRENRWGKRDLFSVELSIDEALVNAIKHGNQLDADKEVRILCRLSDHLLRLEITDEGEGFTPETVPDPTSPDRIEQPSGRGIMLMRSFMSRV